MEGVCSWVCPTRVSERGDVAALLWWERVHAAVARVPPVHDAFLKGRGGGESPRGLVESVARLAAGVLGGLGPVAAPLQQQGLQEGLRPVRRVVHAVKRVMEA